MLIIFSNFRLNAHNNQGFFSKLAWQSINPNVLSQHLAVMNLKLLRIDVAQDQVQSRGAHVPFLYDYVQNYGAVLPSKSENFVEYKFKLLKDIGFVISKLKINFNIILYQSILLSFGMNKALLFVDKLISSDFWQFEIVNGWQKV